MDEVFFIFLGILLAAGIILTPIFAIFMLISLRWKTEALGAKLDQFRQDIDEKLEKISASVPPPEVEPESPAEFKPAKAIGAAPEVPVQPPPMPATMEHKPVSPVAISPPPTPPPSVDYPIYREPESEPGAFEAAARRILAKIWSWIIVGEEHRPKNVSVEYAVATNWLVRGGVIILVFGMGFFLKYSSEHGWLGPMGKVSLSLLTGTILIAAGIQLLDRRYHILAQGLLGAGLATLYAGIFAAANLFDLIMPETAFLLMAVVTVGAGVMSVRFNSMLVAILGIIGGYGTPVMLSTGSANFIGLYTYMLLLGLGVLGIAHRRNWHLLNFLAFAATYGLVVASIESYFQINQFWEVMPFLVAFFVVFSTVIFIYQLINARKATLLELLMLILNASLFFGISYSLIKQTYTTEWSSLVSLGLTTFYIGHLYLFMARRGRDRGLAISFIALSSFFLIITVPLLLSSQWLTLCWSVQALVLLWVAGKMNSRFLQYVAYGLYAMVFGRFFFLDLHRQFTLSVPSAISMGAYLGMLTERLISFGVPVACVAGGMWLSRVPPIPAPLTLDASTDVREWVERRRVVVASAIAVFSMLFLYLHLELNRTLMFLWDPLRLPALTMLWLMAATLFLALYLYRTSAALFILFLVFGLGALVKMVLFDLPAWHFSFEQCVYFPAAGYSFLDASMRLVDFGVMLAFLVYAFLLLRRREDSRNPAKFFGYGSIVLLFFYTTMEINTFFSHFVFGMRAGALSVYWGLFALALVLGGILRTVPPLRIAGLILFALVALKVFFFDLDHLDALYRIIAFLLLGGVLLTGAFIYLKFQDRFSIAGPSGKEK